MTSERFSNLRPRDVTRPSSGFLFEGEESHYECPDCSTRRRFSETELVGLVFERSDVAPEERLDFECAGCGLEVRVGVRIDEIPSWSSNFRAHLDYRLVERPPT